MPLTKQWWVAALVLAACQQAPAAPSSGPQSRAVATVNGVSLTEADLELAMRSKGHTEQANGPERRAAVLETLVRDELRRQRAVELGLAPSGPAADELARAQVQLDALRRRALSDALLAQQAGANPADPELEARRFFDANQALVRTEVQVWQLLLRDEAKLQALLAEIRAGTPFEEVARRQFAGLPEAAGRPWELGFIGFQTMPPQWREVVLKLKEGEVSDVIRGPAGRVWVLKLIARRQNAELTFEQLKPAILEELRHTQLEAVAATLDRELKAKARLSLSP